MCRPTYTGAPTGAPTSGSALTSDMICVPGNLYVCLDHTAPQLPIGLPRYGSHSRSSELIQCSSPGARVTQHSDDKQAGKGKGMLCEGLWCVYMRHREARRAVGWTLQSQTNLRAYCRSRMTLRLGQPLAGLSEA